MRSDFLLAPALFGLAALLSGCAGVAQGVTRAIIESRSKGPDTRECFIRGAPFEGLEGYLERQEAEAARGVPAGPRPVLKVLMIHGIGEHSPGYATRLAGNLGRELGLTRQAERYKQWDLEGRLIPGGALGTVRATRLVGPDGVREMNFFELTWDPVIEEEKKSIAFDSSAEYAFRRAGINNTMKIFINKTVPDVMMYQGGSRMMIQSAVTQAMCWMYSRDWQDLPTEGRPVCSQELEGYLQETQDDYAYITHSLGSRVTTDALQTLAQIIPELDDPVEQERLRTVLQRRVPIFMMSNQLPLLQLGQPRPEVTAQHDAMCTADGPLREERLIDEMLLVAFSDPNDLFSFSIPDGYLDVHMDSRLCPNLVNVVLNIAPVNNLFGLGQFANPGTAHLGYDSDERVLGIITKGIGNDEVVPVVAERCEWVETF